MMHAPVPARRYLFLQGVASSFFAELARALAARGHAVRRINFNGGDKLFWPLRGAVDYRGDLAAWPGFLHARLTEWRITDIVLFGDCRPLHVEASRIAEAFGVAVHVAEEGYLRPNWVTLEPWGVNGHSGLPHDPAWFRAAAEETPAWTGGRPVPSRFARRAAADVLYNVASVLLARRFPGYRRHRPWHPFVEYAGWLGKLLRRRRDERASDFEDELLPFYLFPLQLDCDSQIREHSPYGRMAPALNHVIASFARSAPVDAMLVVKAHPLDNALCDWRKATARLAAEAGVPDRVVYIEGGRLEALLAGSRAVVTVNSTVGVLALALGAPLIALGAAIYDMRELTFQGSLDAFWTQAARPDPETFDAFRRVVAHRTQVNGGFFSREGVAMAVEGAVARLEERARAQGHAVPSRPQRAKRFEATHAMPA